MADKKIIRDEDELRGPVEGIKKIDSDWKSKVKLEKEKVAKAEEEKAKAPKIKSSSPKLSPDEVIPRPAPQEPQAGAVEDGSAPLPPPDQEDMAGEELAEGPADANFMNFISSLAAQVMISLGQEANPMTGRREVNPAQAGYTIDLLAMIKDKTKGNLTKREEQFMHTVLYQLQIAYTEITRQLRSKMGNKP